jgi:hypothetical protein
MAQPLTEAITQVALSAQEIRRSMSLKEERRVMPPVSAGPSPRCPPSRFFFWPRPATLSVPQQSLRLPSTPRASSSAARARPKSSRPSSTSPQAFERAPPSRSLQKAQRLLSESFFERAPPSRSLQKAQRLLVNALLPENATGGGGGGGWGAHPPPRGSVAPPPLPFVATLSLSLN